MGSGLPGQDVALSLAVLTAFSAGAMALAVWIAARPQD
jgi:hypothetical protein